MKRVSAWGLLFILGASWRGKRWSSWPIMAVTSLVVDLAVTEIFTANAQEMGYTKVDGVTECLWRNLFMACGLIFGASLTLFLPYLAARQRQQQQQHESSLSSSSSPISTSTRLVTLAPCIIMGCTIALSDTLLGTDIDEMVPIMVGSALLATAFMIQGTWSGDLLYVVAGALVTTPCLNIASAPSASFMYSMFSGDSTNVSDIHIGNLSDEELMGVFIAIMVISGVLSLPISVVKGGPALLVSRSRQISHNSNPYRLSHGHRKKHDDNNNDHDGNATELVALQKPHSLLVGGKRSTPTFFTSMMDTASPLTSTSIMDDATTHSPFPRFDHLPPPTAAVTPDHESSSQKMVNSRRREQDRHSTTMHTLIAEGTFFDGDESEIGSALRNGGEDNDEGDHEKDNDDRSSSSSQQHHHQYYQSMSSSSPDDFQDLQAALWNLPPAFSH